MATARRRCASRFSLLAAVLLFQAAAARGELSPQERAGRELFQTGLAREFSVTARLAAGGPGRPAAAFPCANCHGERAEGGQEAGVRVPAIDWGTLSAPRPGGRDGPARPAYDGAAFAEALRGGVDPAGRALGPVMPRFDLTDAALASLAAYLRRAGEADDADPGIAPDTLRLGTLVPLSGPEAEIGEAVLAALQAGAAGLNRAGGLYGRRVEIVAADSHGRPALAAARALLEGGPVFALVGGLAPAEDELTAWLAARRVPWVGPVGLSRTSRAGAADTTFALLPSLHDQARALVDFAARRLAPGAPVLLVHGNDPWALDALQGAREQLARHGGLAATQSAGAPPAATLRANPPRAVLVLGDGPLLLAAARTLRDAGAAAELYGLSALAGGAVAELDAATAARTFMAHGQLGPDAPGMARFLAAMARAGAPLARPAQQSLAYAALELTAHAARAAGRRLSRRTLVAALEALGDHDSGITGPLSFGAGRRIGASGARILAIDPARGTYLPAEAGWRVPLE